MNNFLHAAVPFAGNPDRLTHDVGTATRGCGKIDVLALGPWTSYLRYAPALGPNVRVNATQTGQYGRSGNAVAVSEDGRRLVAAWDDVEGTCGPPFNRKCP